MPDKKSDEPKAPDAPKPAAAPAPAPKLTPEPAKSELKPEQDTSPGDGDTVHVEGGSPSRGAQVILTGEGRDAARGGLAGDIEGNTLAKRALEADGTIADGTTPDGSTLRLAVASTPVNGNSSLAAARIGSGTR